MQGSNINSTGAQGGPKITPDMVLDVNCSECDNDKFKPIFYMKKIPKFVAQSDKDMFTPIQSWECSECKNINFEFQIKNLMGQ